MNGERPGAAFDVVAVALAMLLAVIVTISGARTGYRSADADELVYRQTLLAMRSGEGVYPAQRDALIRKEHHPPTSVRAIRPPVEYLALRLFPPGSWRWLVGVVYLVDLLLSWRLARIFGGPAGAAGVVLAGVWLIGFSPYLFLHAEVWGLPFFLGSLINIRHHRTGLAVTLLVLAASIRELYAVGLLVGLMTASAPLCFSAGRVPAREAFRRSIPWVAGIAVVSALFGLHALLAAPVLARHGYEARLGNEERSWSFVFRELAPWVSTSGEAFGAIVTLLGVWGAVRVARRDPAALVGGATAVVLLGAAQWATRVYWSAAWAIPISVFAPAVFSRRALLPPVGVEPRGQGTPATTR